MSLFHRIKDPVEGSMHVVAATQLDPGQLRVPGADLPVVFDREKTDRIEIQWDQVMTTNDSARMHADELAAELRGDSPTA